jgi:hypothetical protein
LGALAVATVGPLFAAGLEVRRHDQRVRERDDDLEGWLVSRHRQFQQRLNELRQQQNAAGVLHGGAPAQARTATATIALYEYREALRQARADRARILADEAWSHRVTRWLRRRPLPELTTPERATRLLDHWAEGTDGNALTWALDDIIREIGERGVTETA